MVVAKAGLIALMVVGSLMLWIGIPVGWLWLGSQLSSDSQQATLGIYLVVLAGIVACMIITAKLLTQLNGLYGRVTGEAPEVRVRAPWHRSMRGDEDHRPPRQILDVVMVVSVGAAFLALGVWFLVFAGSPLPG